MDQVTFGLAFVAGLVSFISPCVVALVPTYLTYLAGTSFSDLESRTVIQKTRRRVLLNAIAFVTGFSIVFIAFGMTASVLGQALITYSPLLRRVSGVLIIGMGFYMMGVLHVPWFDRTRKMTVSSGGQAGPGRSLLLGATFSAGWTPCIGPILASILMVAGNSDTLQAGTLLLAVYSLGLAVPFLVAALFLNSMMRFLKKLGPHLGRIRVASGALLVVVGVMVYTNQFVRLSGLVNWSF